MLKKGQRILVVRLGQSVLAVIYTSKNLNQHVEVKRIPKRLKAENGSMQKHLTGELASDKAVYLRRVPLKNAQSSDIVVAFDVGVRKT